MSALIRLRGLVVVALMLAAGVSNQTDAADSIEITGDGWHRWQVPSVGHPEDETIYVLIKSGKATEIEIRGHWCNGHSHKNAIDHGVLSVDESIDWLQQYLGTRSDLSSDALAAISRHAGDRSLKILIDIVESDAHKDIREEAVFWMAMSESEEAFDYIDRLLMGD
jgi:hypothetical protein